MLVSTTTSEVQSSFAMQSQTPWSQKTILTNIETARGYSAAQTLIGKRYKTRRTKLENLRHTWGNKPHVGTPGVRTPMFARGPGPVARIGGPANWMCCGMVFNACKDIQPFAGYFGGCRSCFLSMGLVQCRERWRGGVIARTVAGLYTQGS